MVLVRAPAFVGSGAAQLSHRMLVFDYKRKPQVLRNQREYGRASWMPYRILEQNIQCMLEYAWFRTDLLSRLSVSALLPVGSSAVWVRQSQ